MKFQAAIEVGKEEVALEERLWIRSFRLNDTIRIS